MLAAAPHQRCAALRPTIRGPQRACRPLRMQPRRAYLEEKGAGASSTSSEAAVPAGNQLAALRAMSVVVADTGDVALVKKFKPIDCTTNPSLVLKAMQQPEYQPLMEKALAAARRGGPPRDPSRPMAGVADVLSCLLGAEMLGVVPGRVSTEVDAHLSFDAGATYDKAMRLVELYGTLCGVGPERLYIKLASTYEGVQAARRLQQQGVDCNCTLLFSFGQAAACADAGAALISPFVGRILDWHKKREGRDFAPHEDPGVASVRRIYDYYKTHGYKTTVMAASFRNKGEITELAGCDHITISPLLLGELEASAEPLPRRLSPEAAASSDARVADWDAGVWAHLHGGDEMAVEKLQEGIDGFAADQKKLEEQLARLASELGH